MSNLIGLAALALATAAGAGGNYESTVTLDGRTFRVHVEGRSVTVANKAFLTRRSPERADQMRRAVKAATGCEIGDSYWEGTKLRGLLDCG